MKRFFIITLFVFSIFIISRLIFSYTIITIPSTNGKVFTGASKLDFPICIVNPLKTKSIKENIIKYAQLKIESDTAKEFKSNYEAHQNSQFKRWFHNPLSHIPEFRIQAIHNQYEAIQILLGTLDDSEMQCVVFMDKQGKNILHILF